MDKILFKLRAPLVHFEFTKLAYTVVGLKKKDTL